MDLSFHLKVGDNPTIINNNSNLKLEFKYNLVIYPSVGLPLLNLDTPRHSFISCILVYNTATVSKVTKKEISQVHLFKVAQFGYVLHILVPTKSLSNSTNKKEELSVLLSGNPLRSACASEFFAEPGNIILAITSPISSDQLYEMSDSRGFLSSSITNLETKAIINSAEGFLVYFINYVANCVFVVCSGSLWTTMVGGGFDYRNNVIYAYHDTKVNYGIVPSVIGGGDKCSLFRNIGVTKFSKDITDANTYVLLVSMKKSSRWFPIRVSGATTSISIANKLCNYNFKYKKMENSVLTQKEDLKRDLIRKFSNEKVFNDVNKINISIVYKDNIYLKYLKFPKSIYRQYFLQLLTNDIIEKIRISVKDKNEVKQLLKLIYV